MILKNRHFILFICLLLIVLNHSVVYESLKLWFYLLILLSTSFKESISLITLPVLDILLSVVILLVLIFITLFKKWKLLEQKTSLISCVSFLLILFFTIPSMVTTYSPDYYNDIKKTKLLPPFTSVYYTVQVDKMETSPLKSFLNSRNRLLYLNTGGDTYVKETKIFILGTDEFGRDVASRVIYGTRVSFITGVLAVSLSLIFGLLLGFISGSRGGMTDIVLNRIVEMLLSFPAIFLVILFVSFFGSSLISLVLLLGLTGWMSLFKVVRGEVLLLRGKDYFLSARLLGGNIKLLFTESLSSLAAAILLTLVLQFSNVILAEAALSYLGLGTGNTYPSWGSMIQEGQSYIYKAWWMIIIPGIFLITSLSIINNLGRKLGKFSSALNS